jgi:CO dehydrogenase/acetyl-CoA synthase delta subunit
VLIVTFIISAKTLTRLTLFRNLNFNLFSSIGQPTSTRLGYGLDYRGSRIRLPAGAGNFSLHHRVQYGSGAHPASYQMGTRGSFPGGEADHSPPSTLPFI